MCLVGINVATITSHKEHWKQYCYQIGNGVIKMIKESYKNTIDLFTLSKNQQKYSNNISAKKVDKQVNKQQQYCNDNYKQNSHKQQ